MTPLDTSGVLARLDELRAADAPTGGGRVLSYVYDSGMAELDDLAAAAMRKVQAVNGLDPTTFTSVPVMEHELLEFTKSTLHGGSEATGTITAGGTESCLLAVKTARDAYRARHTTGRPEMIIPTTAHAAFRKAAWYFDLDLVTVDVDPQNARVDASAVARRIGPKTALVVVSAPCYPYAAMDPVAAVAATAEAAGVPCHVDACMGGWVLPFADRPEDQGNSDGPWDFRSPGVTSISADLHKYGYAPKGVSALMYSGRDYARRQYFALTDWPGYPVVNPTMLGSKPAGPLAAAWAIVSALGVDGYKKLSADALSATSDVRRAIAEIDGLRVIGDPVGPLLAFSADTAVPADRRVDPHRLADAAAKRGWILQGQPGMTQPGGSVLPASTHLTFTPVSRSIAGDLIVVLNECANDVRGVEKATADPRLIEAASRLPDDPDSDTLWQLLAAAGLGAGLPGEMADVLALVETLDHRVGARLLTEFLARFVEPGPCGVGGGDTV